MAICGSTNYDLRFTIYEFVSFAGFARIVVKLRLGYCPRFKARGVNGSSSHAVCDAVAMLNNLSIVICTLSILPDKLQFVELYGEPKVSGIS